MLSAVVPPPMFPTFDFSFFFFLKSPVVLSPLCSDLCCLIILILARNSGSYIGGGEIVRVKQDISFWMVLIYRRHSLIDRREIKLYI